MNVQSMSMRTIPSGGNRSAEKRETSQASWAERMKEADEMIRARREARLQDLSAAKKSLTPAEVNDLADQLYTKYDPEHMTMDEYRWFIEDLVSGGALTRTEAEGFRVGNALEIDPFSLRVREMDSPLDNIFTLADANGNARLFVHTLTRWVRGNSPIYDAQMDAAEKASDILDAMLARRKQAGLHDSR